MKAAIITLLMSMVPVIELRGAIPYGVVAGLSVRTALAIAIIGNIIPVPFLIVFTRRVFVWIRKYIKILDRWISKLEDLAERKQGIVEKYEFFGLMILVAIPLPGTGAWTGALVAAMMDMRLKRAMPSIVLGVIIAGIIVTTVTYGAALII